jgi:enoyl-CoA hydratase
VTLAEGATDRAATPMASSHHAAEPPMATQTKQAIADFVAPMKDTRAFTMRVTKLAANSSLDGDTPTLIALESMTCNVAHQSEDAQEGVQAFLEKRNPIWKHA